MTLVDVLEALAMLEVSPVIGIGLQIDSSRLGPDPIASRCTWLATTDSEGRWSCDRLGLGDVSLAEIMIAIVAPYLEATCQSI